MGRIFSVLAFALLVAIGLIHPIETFNGNNSDNEEGDEVVIFGIPVIEEQLHLRKLDQKTKEIEAMRKVHSNDSEPLLYAQKELDRMLGEFDQVMENIPVPDTNEGEEKERTLY
jgi:hypothetical protein